MNLLYLANWTVISWKLTQPVLIQSIEDEFEIPVSKQSITLAVSGSILMKCDPKYKLKPETRNTN